MMCKFGHKILIIAPNGRRLITYHNGVLTKNTIALKKTEVNCGKFANVVDITN